MKLTKELFPQFIEDDGGTAGTDGGANPTDRSLGRFTRGGAVPFARCRQVLGRRTGGPRSFYDCATQCYLNRPVMTHETTMYQWKALPDGEGRMEVCLQFWTPRVLRLRFGAAPLDLDEPTFPPKGKGMLIGSPDPSVAVEYGEDDEAYYAHTEALSVRIDKGCFTLRVETADGRLLAEQSRYELPPTDSFDLSVARCGDDCAVFDGFKLANQEEVYGLGERFDHLARRGVTTDFWNKDGFGTSNTRTYINAPFVMSTAGYGIFLNSAARTEWKIGTDEASTLAFATQRPVMDYFLITGDSLQQVLRGYCGLTGFAPVPPIWSFGLWMSRNSYLSWDIVHEVADGLRARGIPADVLHLDTAWFKQDWNCDLRFSQERFPEPERHMAALRKQGFRTTLWQYNFIPPREDNVNYCEAREKGYLALDAGGEIFRHKNDLPGSWKDDAIIDFSNPDAREWYAAQIRRLIGMGAAAVKTDFGEGIPEDAVFRNVSGREFHNLYSLIYNETVFDATREVSGDSIVWARSGTAGSQRCPLHWGGDSQCSFAGLAGTLRAGLSAGLSGFVFFSHDIGGFIGRPTPELYIRWAQLGLLSSHSRCHGGGNNNSREPWAFGQEAERIFTAFVKLRYALLPYLITEAHYCAAHAVPMMKALVLDDDTDLNVRRIDDEYLFGRNLLVAPILQSLRDTCERRLYLPRGVWYDFWTKEKRVSAGEWITVPVTLDKLPLFVRGGGVLPYGRGDKQWTEDGIYPVERVEIYGEDADYVVTDGRTDETLTARGGKAEYRGASHPEIVFYR